MINFYDLFDPILVCKLTRLVCVCIQFFPCFPLDKVGSGSALSPLLVYLNPFNREYDIKKACPVNNQLSAALQTAICLHLPLSSSSPISIILSDIRSLILIQLWGSVHLSPVHSIALLASFHSKHKLRPKVSGHFGQFSVQWILENSISSKIPR